MRGGEVMKRIFKAISIVLLAMVLFACGSKPKPEASVVQFLSAAQKLDIQAMSATIDPSSTDALNKTKDLITEEEDDYSKFFLEYLKSNASKLTYSISGSEVNGDKAVVTVNAKYVNGAPLMKATFGEVLMKVMGMAFAGIEPTEDETNQMFTTVMEEQSKIIGETFKESTIKVDCVNKDGKWYICQISDELLDVVMSGFLSLEAEITDSFGEDGSEVNPEDDPEYMLGEIANYIIGDVWNDGFNEISTYLEEGKGSMGQELDYEFTLSQFDRTMEKKAGYDAFISGLDNSYGDIKEVWNKLSPEIDKLYQQIKSGATSINTDFFYQYMNGFLDMIN